MSTSVFPSLPGVVFPVTRSPVWSSRRTENVSGKEVRQTDWTYPRWMWEMSFSLLRQGTVYDGTYTEMSQLAGFFNNRKGAFDSFLYQDDHDFAVVDQSLGLGDGVNSTFQLVRSFGSFIEPIYAPNVLTDAKINGVAQGGVTMTAWGSTTPGKITFTSPPSNGSTLTATFSYYFPVTFVKDEMGFELFMKDMYAGKKVQFRSIK